jgi:hypothetical protein
MCTINKPFKFVLGQEVVWGYGSGDNFKLHKGTVTSRELKEKIVKKGGEDIIESQTRYRVKGADGYTRDVKPNLVFTDLKDAQIMLAKEWHGFIEKKINFIHNLQVNK